MCSWASAPHFPTRHSVTSRSVQFSRSVVSDSLPHDRLTIVYQAPPFMGFSRQEYWRGLPFPSPGDLPDPGIELGSPAL